MPNNFLNAAGSFGEGFLKTIQSQREEETRQKEFQQKMGFEERQLKLLDIYRNNALAQDQSQFGAKLGQDQSQFNTGINFKEKSLSEDIRQFDLSFGLKQTESDRDYELGKKQIGLGYSKLRQDESKVQPSRSEVDQRQVEELFGKTQGYLDQFKGDPELSKTQPDYGKWKQNASSDISQLLEKVGVPINGEVVNYIRGVVDPKDDSETKRKLLNEAINEIYSQKLITEEQKRALQIWKELGTR